MDIIEIDGKDGGGQLLRSALSLALCTGTGFRMQGIRAGRNRPGLLRQHLACIAAACAVGGGEAVDATPGSTKLTFKPGRVLAGDYSFAIGSAGSTSLVLQTVLPALWQAAAPSRVRVEGGTHNPLAPSTDFLQQTYLPTLARMDVQVALDLECHGFYPAGGGVVTASVQPCRALKPLSMLSRGALEGMVATALLSALAAGIGRRELSVLGKRLGLGEEDLHLRSIRPAIGPGNALSVCVRHLDHLELFSACGERGVSAEVVAERLALQVKRYLASPACIGEHLADQLLLPMALAGGGEFTTCIASGHLRSNAALIEKFVAVEIDIEAADDALFHVRVRS